MQWAHAQNRLEHCRSHHFESIDGAEAGVDSSLVVVTANKYNKVINWTKHHSAKYKYTCGASGACRVWAIEVVTSFRSRRLRGGNGGGKWWLYEWKFGTLTCGEIGMGPEYESNVDEDCIVPAVEGEQSLQVLLLYCCCSTAALKLLKFWLIWFKFDAAVAEAEHENTDGCCCCWWWW